MGVENTFTIYNSFSTLQSLRIFVKFLKKQEELFDEKWPRVTFLLSHVTHVFDPRWSTVLSYEKTELVLCIIKRMCLNNGLTSLSCFGIKVICFYLPSFK